MRTEEALRYAQERDLDLVEVAPEAKPPVCRVLDYSKYKYEQAQKQKAARKHQKQINDPRDQVPAEDRRSTTTTTKKGHVERFLKHKDKVKVTIMFRGREQPHPERGEMILDRLAEELDELAVVEQRPNQDGRNMTMMLGPSKAVLKGDFDKDGAGPDADAPRRDAERRRAPRLRRGTRRGARRRAEAPSRPTPRRGRATPERRRRRRPTRRRGRERRRPRRPTPRPPTPTPAEADGSRAGAERRPPRPP